MKRKIDVFDYANQIMRGVSKGVLLTTKSADKINSMTISWGALAIEWGKPHFIVYVRENRYTKKLLDENPEFSINIAIGEDAKKILAYCGTKSGKNVDKIKNLNLTLVEGEDISVPAIKELALTIECKVVYKQEQDKTAIKEENKLKFYPKDVDSSYHGANKDYHSVYYGEIVNAYIIE